MSIMFAHSGLPHRIERALTVTASNLIGVSVIKLER